jgi:hypothetical protein
MARFTLEDATEEIINYALTNECEFAVELMNSHEQFDTWADYILSTTMYGAALTVAFRDNTEGELMLDLRELWEEKKGG